MKHALDEYCNEVIDEICSLDGCSHEEAKTIAAAEFSDIEYGHKYRLSPAIIAGAILGINDCCITPVQKKPNRDTIANNK